MRVLARPGLLLRRRLNAIERQVLPAVNGEIEGVHQARVASRRLREMLPLLVAVAGEHATRALRRNIRTITRRLGPLREIDVALATLADLETSAPEHAAAIAFVRIRTALERERMWPQVGRALARIHVGHLVRRVRDLATKLDSPEEMARCAAQSAARLEERIARLDEAVGAVGAVYAPGPLHEVRIALKTFRYALEIVAELGRFRLDGSIKRLKLLQDLLGILHDLQVLASRVRDCEAESRTARTRRQLRALADDLDERVRQLHSRYLDERVALVPVVGRARHTAVTLGLMGKPLPE
ncbi:MAG: CHAD domain-containing protein [Acidobacteria bacterium]|jgi:CHAD domain-containing protein|nr:CHAD domain-containing protein [Acidobacteriota bacterium]